MSIKLSQGYRYAMGALSPKILCFRFGSVMNESAPHEQFYTRGPALNQAARWQHLLRIKCKQSKSRNSY